MSDDATWTEAALSARTRLTRLEAVLVALVTLVALTACGPEGGLEGDDGGISVDATLTADDVATAIEAGPRVGLDALLDAYCPRMAEAYCARVEACGCAEIPGYPSDCEARYETSCRATLERRRGVVERGEAIVDLEAIPACVEALTRFAASCVSVPSDVMRASCAALSPPGGFPPNAERGEPCDDEVACADELRCLGGVCAPGGEVAAPCGDARDCRADLECLEGRCGAIVPALPATTCTSDDACAPGFSCLASVTSRCSATATGDVCRREGECQAGMVCAIDEGEEAGRCALAPAAGEPCFEEVTCAAGLACVEGRCAAPPSLGEPCAAGPRGPVVCAEGLSCVARRCSPQPGEGETCALGVPHCAEGLGCVFEGADNVCRARRGEGGACDGDEVCLDGLHCDVRSRACRPHLETGERCVDGNECGPGAACLVDEAFTLRCGPAPLAGEACLFDECAGGLACRRVAEHGACAPSFCAAFLF